MRMIGRMLGVTAGLALSLAACERSNGPAAPSGPPNPAQSSAIADTIGNVTMSAMISGGFPAAAMGQTHATVACPGGGRADLVYVRDSAPAGGVLDASALKAVYGACAFNNSGSTVQFSGELGMSGQFKGTSQPTSLRMNGALDTSAGQCSIDGSVVLTGAFEGDACGRPTKTNPAPRTPAAMAAVGNYSLSVLGGSSLPRIVVTRPCTGYMDTGGLALRGDGTYELTMDGHFVCLNGDGPKVSYAEPGTWAMFDDRTVVFSTISQLFALSPASVSGSTVSLDLDVPSSAPDIPPTRMSATFNR